MFNKLYSKIKENIFQFILLLIIIFVLIGSFIELPYSIYVSGGTSDLSSKVQVVNEESNTGKYKSLYVLTLKANIFTYLIAKINNNWDIIKNEDISINKEKYDEIFTRDRLYLEQSKNNAIEIAYKKANKNYKITDTGIYVIGSECDIKIGERINKIDEEEITEFSKISEVLKNKKIGDEVKVETLKDNKKITRNIKIKEKDGKKVLGIYIISINKIETENDIKINMDKNSSGSSGGLMLTLTIYDKITDIDLSRGRKIVGTGTIEEDGTIGKIDGLKYKMIGLSKEKYDVFFIPYENKEEADEINKKYNLNLKYIPISTFDEAVEYLLSVNN